MFCNKCGKQLPDGLLFCNKCGNKISSIYSAGENSPAEVEKDLQQAVESAPKATVQAVESAAQPVVQVVESAAEVVAQPTVPVYPNPQPAAPVYPNTSGFGAVPQMAQPPQPAVAAGVRCPVCGNALVTGAAFCNVCGNPVGYPQYPQYPQGVGGAKASKKSPLKYIIIPAAALAVAAIIIVAIVNSAKPPADIPSGNGGGSNGGGFASSNEYPSNNGGGNSNGGQSGNQIGGNQNSNQGGNQNGNQPYEEPSNDPYENNGGGQQNNNEQPQQTPQSVEYTGDKTGTVFTVPQNAEFANILMDDYLTTYPAAMMESNIENSDIMLNISLDGGLGFVGLDFHLDTDAAPLQEGKVYNTRDLKDKMNFVSISGVYSTSYISSNLDSDCFDDMMLKLLEFDEANNTMTFYFYASTHYKSDSHVYEGVGLVKTD